MTLFQSLAFAAGYDPVAGPGSDCSAEGSSGRCVVPWAGGTKNVNSVVLVATGVSFVVSPSASLFLSTWTLRCLHIDYELDFYDNRFRCRLREARAMAASDSHRNLLERTICECQPDR